MAVNKSVGINRKFLSLTADFTTEYLIASQDVGLAILFGGLVNKKLISEKITKALLPLMNGYFKDSVAASNKIVPAKISRLTDQLNVPFKYDKSMLEKLNDKAIWTGYYDADVKKVFKTTEINKMKSAILSAKYGELDEKVLIANIKNIVKITDNKARLMARAMSSQLDTAANEIYYGKKAVRDEYDLVWIHNSKYDRHMHMQNEVANEDGTFYDSKTGGRVGGPPYQGSPWNCLCSLKWVKKK